MAKHSFYGGKLHVYKRENSRFWQCSTYLNGRNWRESTGKDSLGEAEDFAEDWYLTLRGKSRSGELKVGKTFAFVADVFVNEFEVITQGQRSPRCLPSHKDQLRVHILPFFGPMIVNEITSATGQAYRVHRATTGSSTAKNLHGDVPAPNTISNEFITIRQVLKTAHRHGWLPFVPDLSLPFKVTGKVRHRAWFSRDEYKQLYQATRERAKNPKKEQWREASEDLHDYVLFMANTGLRPDEANLLQDRDARVAKDRDTGQTIVEIEVRGKRGVGYCKSMPGAVRPLQRLRRRKRFKPTDLLFPSDQRELFNAILTEEELKFDREGNRRTRYSLRHTYICFRLLEGADIYQVAKNCRTSVEMIEKHYAVHLKNSLDASLINVRRNGPWNGDRQFVIKNNIKKIAVGEED